MGCGASAAHDTPRHPATIPRVICIENGHGTETGDHDAMRPPSAGICRAEPSIEEVTKRTVRINALIALRPVDADNEEALIDDRVRIESLFLIRRAESHTNANVSRWLRSVQSDSSEWSASE